MDLQFVSPFLHRFIYGNGRLLWIKLNVIMKHKVKITLLNRGDIYEYRYKT